MATKPTNFIQHSEQTVQNSSFDEDFGVSVVEGLVYNPITGQLDRAVQAGQTLPTSGTNPSTVLSYDGNGDLQYITETIGADQYRTTLTYAARVLTNISAAVKL